MLLNTTGLSIRQMTPLIGALASVIVDVLVSASWFPIVVKEDNRKKQALNALVSALLVAGVSLLFQQFGAEIQTTLIDTFVDFLLTFSSSTATYEVVLKEQENER